MDIGSALRESIPKRKVQEYFTPVNMLDKPNEAAADKEAENKE